MLHAQIFVCAVIVVYVHLNEIVLFTFNLHACVKVPRLLNTVKPLLTSPLYKVVTPN